MGELHPLPEFGEINLDLEDDHSETRRRLGPSSSTHVESAFDELGGVLEDSTRIVSRETSERLAASTRPPPPASDSSATRAWGGIDEHLSFGATDDAWTSIHPSRPSGPLGSSVTPRDGRVAAMRELYAKGDAEGALALAAMLSNSLAPAGYDHPDASVSLELGELSLDFSDPFGGLIPVDDELALRPTAAPAAFLTTAAVEERVADERCTGPLSMLTLTERQSILRLRVSMAELLHLKADHRAGFLLAHVDGMNTLEEILDICAMPPAEALELLATLRRAGVIELE